MDKKSRIWLIVLALLLIVALILCVVFKLRADELGRRTAELEASALITEETTAEPTEDPDIAAMAELEVRIAELTSQLESAQQLEADLRSQVDQLAAEHEVMQAELQEDCGHQALIDEKQTELDVLQSELSVKQTELADMQTQISTNEVDITALQTELDTKQTELTTLQTEIATYAADMAALQAELETNAVDMAAMQAELETNAAELAALTIALEEKQAELDTASTALAAAETALADMTAQRDTAETSLTDAEAKVEELTAALEGVSAEYAALEAQFASLTTEKEESLGEGEYHTSASMQDGVAVSADGVSAEYALINNNMSGNSIIFELKLDGEVIYESEKLAPGEQLPAFSLDKPLAAGTYEARAAIVTLSADGGVSSRMSMPVTITVAE